MNGSLHQEAQNIEHNSPKGKDQATILHLKKTTTPSTSGKNTFNRTNFDTPCTSTQKKIKKGSISAKTGSVLAEQIELKKKFLEDEHLLNMKQKEEEHDIKMKIYNEKLKFYKSLNAKLEEGNGSISDLISL